MAQDNLTVNKMTIINNGIIELKLTSPRGNVRICDNHGNHIAKPASSKIDFSNYFIEWMITNNQLFEIVKHKFIRDEMVELKNKLQGVNISLKNSEFYSRAAQKQGLDQTIGDFLIYKYEEIFYSFEKKIDTNLQVKITFKMGDYTLAAHMFVLIGLTNSDITLENRDGIIGNNNVLGSGAKCFWSPSNQIISKIAEALACSSEDHKNDLISLLDDINT